MGSSRGTSRDSQPALPGRSGSSSRGRRGCWVRARLHPVIRHRFTCERRMQHRSNKFCSSTTTHGRSDPPEGLNDVVSVKSKSAITSMRSKPSVENFFHLAANASIEQQVVRNGQCSPPNLQLSEWMHMVPGSRTNIIGRPSGLWSRRSLCICAGELRSEAASALPAANAAPTSARPPAYPARADRTRATSRHVAIVVAAYSKMTSNHHFFNR